MTYPEIWLLYMVKKKYYFVDFNWLTDFYLCTKEKKVLLHTGTRKIIYQVICLYPVIKPTNSIHLKALIHRSNSMHYTEVIKHNHSYKLRTLMSHWTMYVHLSYWYKSLLDVPTKFCTKYKWSFFDKFYTKYLPKSSTFKSQ